MDKKTIEWLEWLTEDSRNAILAEFEKQRERVKNPPAYVRRCILNSEEGRRLAAAESTPWSKANKNRQQEAPESDARWRDADSWNDSGERRSRWTPDGSNEVEEAWMDDSERCGQWEVDDWTNGAERASYPPAADDRWHEPEAEDEQRTAAEAWEDVDRRWEAENYGNGYDNRDYEPGYHEPPGAARYEASQPTTDLDRIPYHGDELRVQREPSEDARVFRDQTPEELAEALNISGRKITRHETEKALKTMSTRAQFYELTRRPGGFTFLAEAEGKGPYTLWKKLGDAPTTSLLVEPPASAGSKKRADAASEMAMSAARFLERTPAPIDPQAQRHLREGSTHASMPHGTVGPERARNSSRWNRNRDQCAAEYE